MEEASKKILFVVIITIITMVLEIVYGFWTNSMGLLADGFHMGTHALALGLAFIAYYFCMKFKNNACFKSGTDKIKELSGYTSSLFLGISGIGIIIESIERLFNPLKIDFNQAMIVVVIGLIVNLVCILIMDFDNINDNFHHHNHEHKERDNNFKSAYFHILADLLTSIFALFALLFAKFFGFIFLDAVIGVLGGIIIIKWAINLLKSTAQNLLDIESN